LTRCTSDDFLWRACCVFSYWYTRAHRFNQAHDPWHAIYFQINHCGCMLVWIFRSIIGDIRALEGHYLHSPASPLGVQCYPELSSCRCRLGQIHQYEPNWLPRDRIKYFHCRSRCMTFIAS
jgi:hypothetical protein